MFNEVIITMKKILTILKKDAILCISLLLAIVSSIIMQPGEDLISYVDWNTLFLLFSLMAVMAGYKKLGLFRLIGVKLLRRTHSTRALVLVLTLLPFFFSMIITNDVALITFVPFALIVLKMAGEERLIVSTVILQTLAANMGSMLTPMGNPQNLYLYSKSDISLIGFIEIIGPYTLLAFVGIIIACIIKKSHPIETIDTKALLNSIKINKLSVFLYTVIFALCILAVAKILTPLNIASVVLLFLIFYDRRVLLDIDYALLGTFIGFFVFIGNMQNLPEFQNFIKSVLEGNEVIVSVLASQVISNVPAALLLSGFTENFKALIIGVNLGGLGTLIASMASLISYKQIAREYPGDKGRYIIRFTFANILMLAVLLCLFYIIY